MLIQISRGGHRLLMAERVGCETPCWLGSLCVREVVAIVRIVVYPCQETGKHFSSEKTLLFQILNSEVPMGKCK